MAFFHPSQMIVLRADRRLRKARKLLDFAPQSLSLNSASFIRVDHDKSVRSYADPGKRICAQITSEHETLMYLTAISTTLNHLSRPQRDLLYDFFINGLSLTQLAKNHHTRDPKGSLYFALLQFAVKDPEIDFNASDYSRVVSDCKRWQKKIQDLLTLVVEGAEALKSRLARGIDLHLLKSLPNISKTYNNSHYFTLRSGTPRDYKRRSVLALGLYWMQHPDVPQEVIEIYASKLDTGKRFLQHIAAHIEKEQLHGNDSHRHDQFSSHQHEKNLSS